MFVGSLHLSSCPAQVMIPIFLIVGGASFLSSIVLLRKLNKLAQKNDEDRTCYRNSFTVALIFQLGWFIAGKRIHHKFLLFFDLRSIFILSWVIKVIPFCLLNGHVSISDEFLQILRNFSEK